MKKLKISIHFYGHLRTFRECLPSIVNHLIKSNNAHVFMHTWNEFERKTESWYESEMENGIVTPEDIEFISQLFPEFYYLIENQINVNSSMQTGLSRAYESLSKSLYLRKKNKPNEDYDVYIIIRPDIILLKDIDLELISNNLLNSYFDTRIIQASYIYSSPSLWASDSYGGRECLMFGNKKAINKLSNMKIKDDIYTIPESLHRNGESIFGNILQTCGLGTEIIKFNAPEFWAIKRINSILK